MVSTRTALVGMVGVVGLSLLVFAAGACSDPDVLEAPEGMGEADPSGGPAVQFDTDVRPFPNAPFPNNAFTRQDDSSPTGLAVDLPGGGEASEEGRLLDAINQKAGFGVFSPITVSFDDALDVEALVDRHQTSSPDFSEHAVFLVDVDPSSPEYGQFRLLDMGLGNYPLTHSRPDGYYAHDPKSDGTNLLFPTADHHGGEPNLLDPEADPLQPGQLLDFYERQTDTLILRPVRALRPETTYAVVLSDQVQGKEEQPVDSPFDTVADPDQTEQLAPLIEILPEALPERFDEDLSQMRFGFSFTTGAPSASLNDIRAGLYGEGPMAEIEELFPPRLHMVHDVTGTSDRPLTFELDEVVETMLPIAAQEVGDEPIDALEESLLSIDHFVSGTFLSPDFAGLREGDDEQLGEVVTEIDTRRGTKQVRAAEVPFLCAIPEQKGAGGAPFPTIIYSHAISSTRFELLVFAGTMAKFGFATCTVESPGHGVAIPDEYQTALEMVSENHDLERLPEVLDIHRARDLNNDGEPNSGADYFTSDLLQTRDVIRQTTIDQMQFIRTLRSFDGERTFGEGSYGFEFTSTNESLKADWDHLPQGERGLAGDFTGDGTVDLGGERPYVSWGTSLGGIQSSVLAGADPAVVAAASNAGGAGLIDIAVRSTNNIVRAGVMLPLMGPVLVGSPDAEGTATNLEWIVPAGDDVQHVRFAQIPALEEGQQVVVRNKEREQLDELPPEHTRGEAVVDDGTFRLGVAASATRPADRRVQLGFDPGSEIWDEYGPDVDPSELPEEYNDEYQRRLVDDPTEFGDSLVVEIYDEEGELDTTIDTFEHNAVHAGVLYPADAPLAALSDGWGMTRQTPQFRRFVNYAQFLMEPVDPASWASQYHRYPGEFSYESDGFRSGHTNMLSVGTLGDQVVPISASIAIGRVAGAIDVHEANDAYDMTENQMLIDNFVYEGIAELDRFPEFSETLFDPDDLDEGNWHPDGADPSEGPFKPAASPPLRATRQTDQGLQALRLGYLDRQGEHTFNVPQPERGFDAPMFLTNQVGWFLANAGEEISDDPCQQQIGMDDCDFFSPAEFENPL